MRTKIEKKAPVLNQSSVSANTDWYSTDITPSSPFVVGLAFCISLNTSSVVEVTLDGTNYSKLNGGTALTANSLYIFELLVTSGQSINIRCNQTCIVNFCCIGEFID